MSKLTSLTITDPGASLNLPSKPQDLYVYTAVGSTTWTCPTGITSVEVLVVAGGGGGGAPGGGGGGAGGVVYNSAFAVTPGSSYTVTVGAGGAGGVYQVSPGGTGGNSVFATLTALGGGGGGGNSIGATSGGSGGGASGNFNGNSPGSGTSGQGNAGGQGVNGSGTNLNGGGGGAGTVGGTSGGANSGNGGDGVQYSILGYPQYFGGGGGGGAYINGIQGQGGLGGGGAGSYNTELPQAGVNGLGGGGGGRGGGGDVGARGGSGCVIIRTVPLTYNSKVEIFRTVGSTTWTAPANVTSVEALVVAGGGGGGRYGGGAGAGGLVYNNSYSVTPGATYTVTVGAGGAGHPGDAQYGGAGTNGSNSIFGNLIAYGGGGGGNYNQLGAAGDGRGRSGGSSGGSGTNGPTYGLTRQDIPDAPILGQGHRGGYQSTGYAIGGGGGGGAGGPGQNGLPGGPGGIGGVGLQYSITGLPTYYAGGGGGGGNNGYSATLMIPGGNGGGGWGLSPGGSSPMIDGVPNTGGGGGGGADNTIRGSYRAGNGGSGIVVLRYTTTVDSTPSAVGQTRYNSTSRSIETLSANNQWTAKPLSEPIVTNGLILYYDAARYIKGSTTVPDLSGTKADGTIVGGVTYDESYGGSFLLNGSTGYISVPYDVLQTRSPWTLSSWLRADTSWGDGSMPLYTTYQNNNTNGMWMHFYYNGSLGWRTAGYTSYTSSDAIQHKLTPNAWINYTVTWDNLIMRVYKNGNLVGSVKGYDLYANTSGPVFYTAMSADKPRIGMLSTRAAAGDYNFKGNIATSMVYDRALTELEVLQNYNAQSYRFAVSPLVAADTGNGGGYSIAQGADYTNITGYTNDLMTQFKMNADNQGAGNAATALSYSLGCPSGQVFCYHTGHTVPGWWPMYHAINVTTHPYGKVLNQIEWQSHGNAAGNVDFFGSNKDINQGNFNDESNWSWIGRAHFGGTGGGGADCTVFTRTFNPDSYGYKWYMIKVTDYQNSALTYPDVGSQGGWAMYRLRLNKI